MRVVWSADALADLDAHYRYIAQFNPAAARKMASIIYAAGMSLSTFPERARLGRVPGTRELVIEPYIIGYRVTAHRVEIARVWHHAQSR